MTNYKAVIGLEIHCELGTRSKMFCSCSADHFGKLPNTSVCPICLGLPGALPFANRQAIDWTIYLGLALNCKINKSSKFDRKHYFYPDLPKGYQISQYDSPLCYNGEFKTQNSNVKIRRVHLEEDTAKLIHSQQSTVNSQQLASGYTLIDFNRSGVPLVEIVTEPDLESPQEAREFTQELVRIIRYLGISAADMEKGSLRLEANVSLREVKSEKLKVKSLPDYKVEIKNINSFRFLETAIKAEIERQRKILEKGGKVVQETRGWNEKTKTTVSQRYKEEAKDYRYFPEPDIPVLTFSERYLTKLRENLPEFPNAKAKRFAKVYGINQNYIKVLVESRERADYFEKAAKLASERGITTAAIASAIVNKNLDKSFENPAGLIREIYKVSKVATVPEGELETAVDKVLSVHNNAVDDFRAGKTSSIEFLVGQTMKEVGGRASAQTVKELIFKKLAKPLIANPASK